MKLPSSRAYRTYPKPQMWDVVCPSKVRIALRLILFVDGGRWVGDGRKKDRFA